MMKGDKEIKGESKRQSGCRGENDLPDKTHDLVPINCRDVPSTACEPLEVTVFIFKRFEKQMTEGGTEKGGRHKTFQQTMCHFHHNTQTIQVQPVTITCYSARMHSVCVNIQYIQCVVIFVCRLPASVTEQTPSWRIMITTCWAKGSLWGTAERAARAMHS